MPLRILICGDREWTNIGRIDNIVSGWNHEDIIECIIEGDCRGADRLAGLVAKERKIFLIEEPAKWNLYGRRAGPIRNQLMLTYLPNLVLAFHNNISSSSGTKDMIRRAIRNNIETWLYTEIGAENLLCQQTTKLTYLPKSPSSTQSLDSKPSSNLQSKKAQS